MPSWSVSSKSSASSKASSSSKPKCDKTYRRYMPQPFFNAVAEYQLINGGSEKSAIKAILRERGINMTVEEAKIVFGNETVSRGGHTQVHGGVYHDAQGRVWMDEDESLEYTHLMSHDRLSTDGDTSGEEMPPRSSTRGSTTGMRRRPAPLQLNPKYGFEDSFVPSHRPDSSAASFVSSAASTTLYSPSVHESAKGSKGVMRSMFRLGRK